MVFTVAADVAAGALFSQLGHGGHGGRKRAGNQSPPD